MPKRQTLKRLPVVAEVMTFSQFVWWWLRAPGMVRKYGEPTLEACAPVLRANIENWQHEDLHSGHISTLEGFCAEYGVDMPAWLVARAGQVDAEAG